MNRLEFLQKYGFLRFTEEHADFIKNILKFSSCHGSCRDCPFTSSNNRKKCGCGSGKGNAMVDFSDDDYETKRCETIKSVLLDWDMLSGYWLLDI